MVPTEPPPPSGPARLTEHAQVVQPWVAPALAVEPGHEPLDAVEHVLQPHGGRDSDVAGHGQSRGHQLHRGPLLRRPLLMHGKAAVIGGRVEPSPALGVDRVVVRRHRAASDCPLVVGQQGQPGASGLDHLESGLPAGGHVA